MTFISIPTTTHYDTVNDIGSGTDKRDVSQMLDLWAHKETPFLNRLSWGSESGGTTVEWVSEHLGYGYIQAASVVGSGATTLLIGASGLTSAGMAVKQLNTGALLFVYDSTDSDINLVEITAIASTNTATITQICASGNATVSLDTTDKLYIIANPVNEGSTPRIDKSRIRTVLSNNFMIMRKDVRITGSMLATDMHAVDNELRHQIALRLKEMQREREMAVLLSYTRARANTTIAHLNGYYGFLEGQSGNHILTTSQDFTESSVNDVAAELYENGATPNVLVGATKQIRKFTTWDRARVRTVPDKHLGGFHVTRYLTDTGIELDLIPMRHFPSNMAFMTDTSLCKLRPKKGRKLILQKLGIAGDYDEWQMISEWSLELRKYDMGCHGMWSQLNG
jgi:hypothetical protein